MMLRTLIVDDEAPARRRIRRLLAAEPDVTIAGEYGDGASAVSGIASIRPDLVFLDVQMPERDGFAVVKALPPGRSPCGPGDDRRIACAECRGSATPDRSPR